MAKVVSEGVMGLTLVWIDPACHGATKSMCHS